MKNFFEKLVVFSLLSFLVLTIGKSAINDFKPMNEIDPGPANGKVK